MSLITMSRLGTHGQWGNQIIQYAFIRTYARRFDLDYQLPAWAGQYFFGHNDPAITKYLPRYIERYEVENNPYTMPIPPVGDEYSSKDFRGWGQYHTSWYAPDKAFIQNLFVVAHPESNRVKPALNKLRSMGDTIITIHLRRGDSGRLIFFFTPIIWCLKWLHEHWSRFSKPVLYIATEDTSLVKHFHYYKPIIAEDLAVSLTGTPPSHYIYPHKRDQPDPRSLDFFPDWFILQNSDVVLASSSTFSVSAAWTSKVNKELWMPRLKLQKFEHVNPWNMQFSGLEHLDDFPGIPGTQIDTNPQFAWCWRGWKPKHPSVPEDLEDITNNEIPL